ncbi:MAG: hypothetical protein P8Y93_10615, partial [Acidobacteriota bacterium]
MARGKRMRWRRPLLGLLAVVVVAIAVVALWIARTWPDVAVLAHENPDTTAFIEAARARGERVEWRWVPYGSISLDLKKAVVAAE